MRDFKNKGAKNFSLNIVSQLLGLMESGTVLPTTFYLWNCYRGGFERKWICDRSHPELGGFWRWIEPKHPPSPLPSPPRRGREIRRHQASPGHGFATVSGVQGILCLQTFPRSEA